MKKQFKELLASLGLKREAGSHYFELDASLNLAMIELAEQEQRPVEDIHADLVSTALAQQKSNRGLWQRWQSLSPREQDVSAFTCLGYTNRQMAVVNSRPMYTSHSRIDMYHQNERGGG
jgi:hypothetical protein